MSKQVSHKKAAFEFERWKQEEATRIANYKQEELNVLLSKIKKEWQKIVNHATKEWEQKENATQDEFSQLEALIQEHQNLMDEKSDLQKQINSMEREIERVRTPVVDPAREERLTRINTLRFEIEKLEKQLTEETANLEEVVASKNKYKKLYIEATTTLQQLKKSMKKKNQPV